MAPTAEERNIVHDIFLNTLDTRQEREGGVEEKWYFEEENSCAFWLGS